MRITTMSIVFLIMYFYCSYGRLTHKVGYSKLHNALYNFHEEITLSPIAIVALWKHTCTGSMKINLCRKTLKILNTNKQ